ncbi:MAG: thioredoxin-like domain-containing protein [Phycisphaerae bacterium]
MYSKMNRVLTALMLFGLAAVGVLFYNYFTSNNNPVLGDAATGIKAPDFPADYTWINTPEPLSFQHQLKGQVVLLDFWTYGCINCIHLIPTEERLLHHFAKEPFEIIGVESAKFTNEAVASHVRDAVLRYGITNPVVVDQNMTIWNMYGVNAWPTLVLVDASGHEVGSVAGEAGYRSLERVIAKTIAADRKAGTLAAHGLNLPVQHTLVSASGLLFPGKIIADKKIRRLFIADTGHNRIVETSWPDALGHCKLVAIYGNGRSGHVDGPAKQAEFDAPQGMAVNGGALYVADTMGEYIRRINLQTGNVSTVLGNGHEVYDTTGGGVGTQQGINSPWDLAARGHTLYIAMAGEHQLWSENLLTHRASAIAGTGGEGLQNGPADQAMLAQPSGLAMDGNILYFADSENSAVRGLNLKTRKVFTVIGHGLFDFGDKNGGAGTALLQHDLGVAMLDGNILVADTYNDKLRLINPVTRMVSTYAGDGKPGTGRPGGPLKLNEPGGLNVSGHDIFIADTNNQRIVEMNAVRKTWHQLVISGLTPPRAPVQMASRVKSTAGEAAMAVRIDPAKTLTLQFNPKLPPLTHLTPDIPISLRITSGSHVIAEESVNAHGKIPVDFAITPATLAMAKAAGLLPWQIKLYYAYCTDGAQGLCVPAAQAAVLKVKMADGGQSLLTLPESTPRQ